MIFFLIIFFILTIYPFNIINAIYKKKYISLLVFLSFFSIHQILLSPLTAFKILDFNVYRILAILISSMWFIGVSCIFFILIFKHKRNTSFYRKILLDSLPMLISVSIVTFILLFLETNFVDTTAYAQVSAFFQNNKYTMDGVSELSGSYKATTQYFLYSAYGDYIPLYQIFNPFACIMMINYSWLNFKENKNKINIILNIMMHASLSILYLAWCYTTTGGNLVIQSTIIPVLFIILLRKELYVSPFMFTFLQFFSSTGSLTSLISVVSLFIYCLLYVNKKQSLYIFLSTIIWIWIPINVFLSEKVMVNNTIKYSIISIEYLMVIIPLILFICFKKKIFVNFNCDSRKEWVYKENMFNLWILIMFIFALIMYPIYIFIFEDSPHFPKLMTLTYIAFFILIFIYSIFAWKSEKRINDEFIFLILNSVLATLAFFIIRIMPPILSDNASIWRINYAVPWMGNVPDIVYFSIIIFYFFISNCSRLFTFKKKFYNISCIFLAFVGFITAVPSFALAFKYGCVDQMTLSSNISKNVEFFTRRDRDYLKSMNINDNTKIFTSTKAFAVLGKGCDVSDELTIPLIGISSNAWIINTYGIVGGIENIYRYSSKVKKEQIKNMNISVDDIKNKISSMNVDFIIVNKFEHKFIDYSIYKELYYGDDIIVFCK